MSTSMSSLLLALRAPGSHWLATLITALDEATADPAFDARQRELLAAVIADGSIAPAVRSAARQRMYAHEQNLAEQLEQALGLDCAAPHSPARRLSVVAG